MKKIGFIGMGNMGQAMLKGCLNVFDSEDLLFTDVSEKHCEAVREKTGAVSYTHLDVYKRQADAPYGRDVPSDGDIGRCSERGPGGICRNICRETSCAVCVKRQFNRHFRRTENLFQPERESWHGNGRLR